MKMNTEHLEDYIESKRPIIYIEHHDFNYIDQIIKKVSDDRKINEFNHATKYTDFNSKNSKGDMTLNAFLNTFLETENDTFLVLKDIHNDLDNSETLYLLKSIALKTISPTKASVTIFLVSTELKIPNELEKLITIFEIPAPDDNEIREILKEWANDNNNAKIEHIDEIIISLKGLSKFEIKQLLNLAYRNGGSIDKNDKKVILEEKEQIIKKSGLLEIVNLGKTNDFEHIGGLEVLKKYLENKSKIFKNLAEARKEGVDDPKGILIVGLPGCGKSLTAKATAKILEMPLLRLDIGKLMGKYVGESEGNLRKAIKTAESVSPCVLWIDEIEKAFSGIGSSNGEVTTRLFGNFLTWLQEKTSPVYVVATSNDISNLPPEFLRKGRFDEIFSVDLPNKKERENIFKIHLEKRKVNNKAKNIDYEKLSQKTDGYNGSDIEYIVISLFEDAFINNQKEINTDMILEKIKNTKSISVTLKDKIQKMKDTLDKYNILTASE